MSTTERQPPPELQFVCIAADGRLKALWGDNAVLLLSAGGEAFAHAPPRPGARPTRQLSEFALSRAAPQLVQALRFRNLHAAAPAYCSALARRAAADADVFALGYQIRSVYWPESAAVAFDAGLVEFLDGGRVAVRSRCSAARVVLDAATRLRFAVCYPLSLGRRGGSTSTGGGSNAGGGGAYGSSVEDGWQHVWQTQVFSTRQYPELWAPALLWFAWGRRLVAWGGA
jgi:hypothetical protein